MLFHSTSRSQKTQEATKGRNCSPQRWPLAGWWCLLRSVRGNSQHALSGSYRQVSVAGYSTYAGYQKTYEIISVHVILGRWQSVEHPTYPSLEIHTNIITFYGKNLSFQPLFIYDAAQSRTGNVWYLCIINNKTRTECSLLLDVTSVAGNFLCWSMMVRGWVSF